MLSRVDDTRVFMGSHDVVYSAVSEQDAQQRFTHVTADARSRQQQQLSNGAAHAGNDDALSDGVGSGGGSDIIAADASGSDAADDEAFEYFRDSRHPPSAQLHPHHPYNAQLLALAKSERAVDRKISNRISSGSRQRRQRIAFESEPMEFVFLPSGEIRPRDECPPGLALPPPASASVATAARLIAESAFDASYSEQQQALSQRKREHGIATVASAAAVRRVVTASARSAVRASDRSTPSPDDSESSDYSPVPRAARRHRSGNNSSAKHSSSGSSDDDSSDDNGRSNNDEQTDGDASASEKEKENVQQQQAEAASGKRPAASTRQTGAAPRTRAAAGGSTKSQREAPPAARTAKQRMASERSSRAAVQQQQEQDDASDSAGAQQPPRRGATIQARKVVTAAAARKATRRRAPLSSPSSASDNAHVAAWSREYKDDHQSPPSAHHTSSAALADSRHRSAAKLDVRDLLSEHSRVRTLRPKAKAKANAMDTTTKTAPATAAAPAQALTPPTLAPPTPAPAGAREQIERLEQQLQREKQRVLDKMTQLLAEQGKTQQLQHQVDVAQTQRAAAERECETRVSEMQRANNERIALVESQYEARVHALEAQVRERDAAAARLCTEHEQLTSSHVKLKDKLRHASAAATATASHDPKSDTAAAASQQLERIVAKLRKFHARVEHWKYSSREALDVCECRADVVGLTESLWLDFPAFPLRELLGEPAQASSVAGDGGSGDARSDADDAAHMLQFLKKRLRLREEELRQTHVKYVELKELCARQCVREADLQNFINEHRLRGNLIIRKDDASAAAIPAPAPVASQAAVVGATMSDDQPRNVQFQEQQRGRESTKTRATNTPPVYFDEGAASDEDDEAEAEDDREGEDDDDDYDDAYERHRHETEYYVREPKVFVQVGRDGVYEHARSSAVLRKLDEEPARARRKRDPREVERIRLVPSPTLARRYERVPAASESHAVRRKAASAATSTRPSARTARQPPPISTARSSGVTRRKVAQPAPSTRLNSARPASVSSRISRTSSAPWV